MNRQMLIYSSCLAALSALMIHAEAFADCTSSSTPNCADVAYANDGAPPSVKPDKMNVHKMASGGGTSELAFFLEGNAEPNVYVVFKCQNYDPAELDCRTPVTVTHGGNVHPTWSIKLTNGNLKKVSINATLEGCDACAAMPEGSVMQETCIHTYCRYPYMVVDVTVPSPGHPSLYPPQDPEVIVDPR